MLAIAQRIRPTWTEIMDMESSIAEAVLGGMPRLDASVPIALGGGK